MPLALNTKFYKPSLFLTNLIHLLLLLTKFDSMPLNYERNINRIRVNVCIELKPVISCGKNVHVRMRNIINFMSFER